MNHPALEVVPAPDDDADAPIRDLLARVATQERLAEDAQPGAHDSLGWPSWSMDTGLTPAQERFVEHWSPQRVLDDSRSVRQLLDALQRWTSTHRADPVLDEALSHFARSQAR